MKKILPLLFIFAGASITPAFSQIKYDMTTISTSFDNYSFLSGGDITRGNGGAATLLVSTSASTGYTDFSGGNNAQAAASSAGFTVAASTYFAFTLTSSVSSVAIIKNISFGERSSGSGPTSFSVLYSTDGFANSSSFGTSSNSNDSTWRLLSVTPSQFLTIPANTSVDFRIYGTGGSSSSAGNFRIDDISITAVPEPHEYGVALGAMLVALVLVRRRSIARAN